VTGAKFVWQFWTPESKITPLQPLTDAEWRNFAVQCQYHITVQTGSINFNIQCDCSVFLALESWRKDNNDSPSWVQ